MKYFGGLAVALAACCSPALAVTLHVDTFNADEQGWISGASAVYKATGGVGDSGFLEVESFNHMAAHNTDARWTGDYAAIGANQVKADLMVPIGSPPMEIRVVLFGVNVNQDRWTSAVAQVVPNDGVWHAYTFPMGPTDIVSPNDSGPYSLIMSNVTRFMLRHDAGEPNHTLPPSDQIEGTLGIDNVELKSASVAIPGDFDGDGDVDGVDLSGAPLGWKSRFGTDLSGADFLVWQRNLGMMNAAGAAAAVPEPTCITLLQAAAALGSSRRRIKNSRPR